MLASFSKTKESAAILFKKGFKCNFHYRMLFNTIQDLKCDEKQPEYFCACIIMDA